MSVNKTSKVDGYVVAKHKLMQVITDTDIKNDHPDLAELCMAAFLDYEKRLIVLRAPLNGQPVVDVKNKHKQTRNRVQKSVRTVS